MSFLRRNRRSSMSAPGRSGAKHSSALNVPMILGAIAIIGVFASVFYVMTSLNHQYTYFTATRDVPAGSFLTSDDIATVTGTGDPSGPNVITNIDDMNARLGTLVVRELLPGDTLQYSTVYFHRVTDTNTDITSQQYAHRFTEILPAGSRAVVITGDPTTTYVRAGDYLDVYFADDNSVRRMFESKVIYAIPQIDPANNAAAGGGVSAPTGTSFVLDLTPQQAQDLVWAQLNGTVRVALAAPDVTSNSSTVITDQTYFNTTYGVSQVGVPGASAAPGSSLPPLTGASAAPTSGIQGLPSAAASK